MVAIEELTVDSPLTYQICIEGSLDRSWSDNVGDISICVQSEPSGPPVTVITGEFQDQAALTGALMQLYGMGLPLLSVKIVGVDMAEG